MAVPTILRIPADVRVSVFEHLFVDSKVTIYPAYLDGPVDPDCVIFVDRIETDYEPSILYTGKAIYCEAQNVLTRSMKFESQKCNPVHVVEAIKALYYPRINYLKIDCPSSS